MPNLTPHQQKLAVIRRDDESISKKIRAEIASALTLNQIYKKYGSPLKPIEGKKRTRTNSGYVPVRQNMQDVMNWNVAGKQATKRKTTKKKARKYSPRGTTIARPSAESYTVRKGDSLSKIAKKHGISLKEIIELNPQIANPDIIYVGDAVRLRSSNDSNSSKKSNKAKASPITAVAEEAPVAVQIPDVNPDEVVRSLTGPQPVNVAPVYPNYNPYQMPGPDIRNYMDAPVSRGLPDYSQLMG